jgi:hypothetical protein
MAAKKTRPTKLLGMVLLVAGAGLAFWGYQKSEGLQSQVSSVLTGSHSDNVMMLYIGAGVCIVVGAILALKK